MSKIIKASNERINVCVVGGGNIGSLLLGDLGTKSNVRVMLFTTRGEHWKQTMSIYDANNRLEKVGHIAKVSDHPADVISCADIILITVPSHVFHAVTLEIESYIQPNTWIGVMPGSGGVEYFGNLFNKKGCTLFGFQRVYGISRIKEYGKSVYNLGKKNELQIASIPAWKAPHICEVLENILSIPCIALPNYLNITLTPSNAILHTTRLYSLFSEYKEGDYWNEQIEFYSNWIDDSSTMLLACDAELQILINKISKLNLTFVKSLRDHYESDTVKQMTLKIKNIPAFKGIITPMVKTKKGYIPDFQSRYFKEDFPYGLCIIKSFCCIADIKTPAIDSVLMWYEKIAGVTYYVNGQFSGEDLASLPIPQNFGIDTIPKIESYYL